MRLIPNTVITPPPSLSLPLAAPSSPSTSLAMSRSGGTNATCPCCGNFIAVKVAVGGQVPGSSYFRCENAAQHSTGLPYFYRFPPAVAPPSSHPPSSTQPPSSAKPSQQQCAKVGCRSHRIDNGCVRRQCRKHCNEAGACTLRAHETHRRQKLNLSQAPLPTVPRSSAPTPLSFGGLPPFASFEDIRSDVLAPILSLERHTARESERTAEAHRQLDLTIGSFKSPSPETESVRECYDRENREDRELEVALPASYAPCPHLPTSPHAFSLLRPSVEPVLPSPPLQGVQASSVLKTAAPLRITTQMNPTWMNTNGGPQIQGDGARDVQAAAPTTFHIRRTISRRPFAEVEQLQRFKLVYIDEDGRPPTVICVEQCRLWPSYILDPPMLARLGRDIVGLEWFSPAHGLWISVSTSYVHTVATDSSLLLRRHGVRGLNEDQVIATFLPTTKPIHLRYNINGERTALRAKYKEKTSNMSTTIDGDDSDIEVLSDVELVSVSAIRKRQIKIEPGASPPRQRPRLSVDTSSAALHPSTSSALPVSSLSSAASLSPLATPSTSATTPPSSPSPSSSASSSVVWPRGQYVVDMASGFTLMRNEDYQHLLQPERFKLAFGAGFKYVRGTYQENARYWWTLATPKLKQEGINAGHTPAGQWSEFRKRVNKHNDDFIIL
ncbi:hypothetical protein B0H13DRAFT_2300787 [Mycena leptocephala]|nr:hypothetical protein B0H13DRAFT_2300787 [Mycena leptocephala]